MRRLVESWIQAEKAYHGNNLAAAIRRMNERREMCVTHSRVSEWRRGVYVPSQVVLSHMLYRTLPWALEEAGIPAGSEQYRALQGLLWITTDKDKQMFVELL